MSDLPTLPLGTEHYSIAIVGPIGTCAWCIDGAEVFVKVEQSRVLRPGSHAEGVLRPEIWARCCEPCRVGFRLKVRRRRVRWRKLSIYDVLDAA